TNTHTHTHTHTGACTHTLTGAACPPLWTGVLARSGSTVVREEERRGEKRRGEETLGHRSLRSGLCPRAPLPPSARLQDHLWQCQRVPRVPPYSMAPGVGGVGWRGARVL